MAVLHLNNTCMLELAQQFSASESASRPQRRENMKNHSDNLVVGGEPILVKSFVGNIKPYTPFPSLPAEEPFLIMADHHEIRKLSVDGSNYTILKQVRDVCFTGSVLKSVAKHTSKKTNLSTLTRWAEDLKLLLYQCFYLGGVVNTIQCECITFCLSNRNPCQGYWLFKWAFHQQMQCCIIFSLQSGQLK